MKEEEKHRAGMICVAIAVIMAFILGFGLCSLVDDDRPTCVWKDTDRGEYLHGDCEYVIKQINNRSVIFIPNCEDDISSCRAERDFIFDEFNKCHDDRMELLDPLEAME